MIETLKQLGSVLVDSKQGVAQIYFVENLFFLCVFIAAWVLSAKKFMQTRKKEHKEDGDGEICTICALLILFSSICITVCAVGAVDNYATMQYPAYYLFQEMLRAFK